MFTGKSILKSLKNASFVIVVITVSILFSGAIANYADQWTLVSEKQSFAENSAAQPAQPVASVNRAKLFPSFVDVVKDKKPAVVNISTSINPKTPPARKRGGDRRHEQFGEKDPFNDFFEHFYNDIPEHNIPRKSLGSGFIISADGYIFTNNHVVEKADEIRVTLSDDKEYEAKIIGSDSKIDIALIKIEAKEPLPFLELGDSEKLSVGEWVIAIGNPFGYEQSVTAGIVSGKGRVIGQGAYDDYIQTDASINPGNSGGPLINIEGQVIGINTAIFTAGGRGNIGIGFALPINMAKGVYKDLKERGTVTRGWLGVMIQKVTPEIKKSFGLKESIGALVGDIVKDSPAEKSGIKRGDLIVGFNGKPIKSVEDLPKLVAPTKPGTKIKLVIIRDGKEKTVDVTVGTLPEEEEGAGRPEAKSEDLLGLAVQEISDADQRRLNMQSKEGVLVIWVDSQGPAFEAGIQSGNVILEINRKEVLNKNDYDAVVSKLKKGDTVTLVVSDGRGTRYTGFTIR